MKVAKVHAGKVFVPLSDPPGRAQFGSGEAVVRIARVECKAALAVIMLPCSGVCFLSTYPVESTGIFHSGHVAGFAFFGAVPAKTDDDNTSVAVPRIVGDERVLTREFLACRAISSSKSTSATWARTTKRATSRPASASHAETSWPRCRR
ncbi:MAG: hypothetical protein ABSA31_06120 [Acidimicrobiales bacterium]